MINGILIFAYIYIEGLCGKYYFIIFFKYHLKLSFFVKLGDLEDLTA